jgi:hypothetical protein
VLVLLAVCAAAAGVVAAHTGGYLQSTFDLFLTESQQPAKSGPVPNAESKRDMLAPGLRLRFPERPAGELVTHSLETAQSYLAFPNAIRPAFVPVTAKPLPKASNALLNDATLASMKARLRLSRSQERYWPPVENALRLVVGKLYEGHKRNPSSGMPIDLDGSDMQQLKSAVGPFLKQLNETQKNEIRALARIVGLEKAIFSL